MSERLFLSKKEDLEIARLARYSRDVQETLWAVTMTSAS